MADQETIIRFSNVNFQFEFNKPLLEGVNFSVRKGLKITLMGQNGAGKSTIFKLMMKVYQPKSGEISIDKSMTVAIAHQVMNTQDRELTLQAYFQKYSGKTGHELMRAINEALLAVNLDAKTDQIIQSFSGGQQARLLLAAALIQKPDLLLLDEPTNNLDPAGIEHLTSFLITYTKSCVVISHDADFLNAFTQGVLYLDSFTHQIEQYSGDYYDVVQEIAIRIEKENRQNARLAREIQENKEKINFFAHKGGKMRNVAKKMKEKVEIYESEKVDVRRDDKTIRSFRIPAQEQIIGPVLTISSYDIIQNHETLHKKANVILGKRDHLLLSGPNGIGKSTLIESIVLGTAKGAAISSGVRVGYYRQDFSTLSSDDTVYQSLKKAFEDSGDLYQEEQLRSIAAGFLLTSAVMSSTIGTLSEGQKGLVSFARLVLQKPGLLILDEPTNHINFRHIPVIATALHEYTGAMVIVSHVPDFVSQIRIDRVLDLLKE